MQPNSCTSGTKGGNIYNFIQIARPLRLEFINNREIRWMIYGKSWLDAEDFVGIAKSKT